MASQSFCSLPLPLDASFYKVKDIEVAFFKKQTGIQDDSELQKHIVEIQAEAFAVYPYPCIRHFRFTNLKISRHPAYEAILKIGKERPGAILLDLGCCFGNDARKAIYDGFPLENVLISDLRPEFPILGHKLFKTTPDTFPIHIIAGDIFDTSFLSPTASPVPTSSPPPLAPPLSTLQSLTPLQHCIAVIHASSFFHLFHEEQRTLAHLLGVLLSPLPGSMIFGSHVGAADTKETKNGGTRLNERGEILFAHSPSSLEMVWVGDGGVFNPEDVVLSTRALRAEKDVIQASRDQTSEDHLLVWSVTRVSRVVPQP